MERERDDPLTGPCNQLAKWLRHHDQVHLNCNLTIGGAIKYVFWTNSIALLIPEKEGAQEKFKLAICTVAIPTMHNWR